MKTTCNNLGDQASYHLLEVGDGIEAMCNYQEMILVVLDKLYDILKPKGIFYLSVKQSHISETFEADSRYGGVEK
jgi:hypothetical protein